jgi:hypothetical protein
MSDGPTGKIGWDFAVVVILGTTLALASRCLWSAC